MTCLSQSVRIASNMFRILVFGVFFVRSPAFAQDSCKVGVFVSSLYDLDYVHQSYAADLWLWSLTDSNHPHSLSNFEFPNSKSVTVSSPSTERRSQIEWSAEQCRATVRHQWKTNDFPFDIQTLHLTIEEGDKTVDKLRYVLDQKNTLISPWITLDGWVIDPIKAYPVIRTYATTYGDPDLKGSSSFSAIELEIKLHRHGLGLFFKLFSGVYIAFAIAMMVFFFAPKSEVRYSLAVGALFAAVANKYIIDSLLPPTVGFTLVDKVHVITFLYILGVVLFSGIAMHFQNKGKNAHSAQIDTVAMWTLLCSYIAINGYVILRATHYL